MILVIDNYDSFTWNLVQCLGAQGTEIEVVRNDAMTLTQISAARPEGIVLSPGPGTPQESGVCLDVLRGLQGRVPILGVCLGHQAMCEVAGSKIVRAQAPVHGKAWDIVHDGLGLFAGLPQPLRAGRYHSLLVDEMSIPETLRITARTPEGDVMAVEDLSRPSYGVQFHPESILTPDGDLLLANFLAVVQAFAAGQWSPRC